MRPIIEKLRAMELEVVAEKGEFTLFALFLRENAPNVWDLLASAPWIDTDTWEALGYLAKKINKYLTVDEVIKISHIAIIDGNNPGLSDVLDYFHVEHGKKEFFNRTMMGQDIQHGYVFTSRGGEVLDLAA